MGRGMPRRSFDVMRPLVIRPHCLVHPEGSALVAYGDTQVLCTATIDDKLPPWLANKPAGKGRGWVSAEYDMLPRATHSRHGRDSHRGKINGRTQEIGRLIGRSLRAVVDLAKLGERMITIDCDVLQADGGTRTAAITGGFVAMAIALNQKFNHPQGHPALKQHVAAVSVGIIDGTPQLDLDYQMDAQAGVDMNVVMSGEGNLVEVQGTAEGAPFSRHEMNAMLDLAFNALPNLLQAQKAAIETPYAEVSLAAVGG